VAIHRSTRATGTRLAWPLAGLTAFAAGCLLAAAGAGAGGGIYFTERGVESTVPASVDRATAAARQAFDELKVTPTKRSAEQAADGAERRKLDGTAAGRDVSVTLTSQGNSTRVQVVATTSAVTWDKEFARNLLNRIVANSR
jgi:hypothetical protein